MWLREEVWRKIHSTTKDSLFVKELAVAIWGTVELRGRSVSGKECPTKNTEAKPPLSPYKLGILKGMLPTLPTLNVNCIKTFKAER